MADEYAELTSQDLLNDTILNAFLAEVPAGGHILDLGCGPGHFAAEMAKRGYAVTATDAVPEMVALASQHNGVRAIVARFEDIKEKQTYDGIWANFSLLHAPREDMPRHLSTLHHALKPGGVFHIGLKTGEGSKRDKIDRLYTYYTLPELTVLLKDAGFDPQDHTFGNDVGLDGERADWVVIRSHA